MTSISSTRTASRIVCVALALFGAGLASPASADWQPRASVLSQSVDTRSSSADWRPRHAMTGAATSRRAGQGSPGWSPRSSTPEAAPASEPPVDISTAWQPRRAVEGMSIARQAGSSAWTPRASLDAGATLAAASSRTPRGRRLVSLGAAPEKLATSSVTR